MEGQFDAGRVGEFIWLGSEDASARSLEELQKRDIKYILTVGVGMESYFPAHFQYKVIPVNDDPQEFLMCYFNECRDFIDLARSNNASILVHCAAGRSRSTTIVCSYLMLTEHCTAHSATEKARENRPFAQPNSGFMYQLRLLERMEFQVPSPEAVLTLFDEQEHLEKALRDYAVLLNNHRIRSFLTAESITNKKTQRTVFPEEDTVDCGCGTFPLKSLLSKATYECRNCSFPLIEAGDILNHTIYPMVAFSHFRIVTGDNLCRYHFIPYLTWMGQIDTADGDLFCQQCRKEVGGYIWQGRGCPCGTYIRPAFYIEVDAVHSNLSPQQ